jgi:hypothetical protein
MKRLLQCIAMCLLFADVYGFTNLHSLPMSLKGHPRTVRPSTWLGMSTEGLRGGAGSPAKKSNGVENHTQEAIAFFGSERLPASLIAGACLSVLFVFQVANPLLCTTLVLCAARLCNAYPLRSNGSVT